MDDKNGCFCITSNGEKVCEPVNCKPSKNVAAH